MFTHLKKNKPHMVNVGDKKKTKRYAKAQAKIKMGKSILVHFEKGDINTPKGPVFHTAIIAGTQAVKKTSELIPFCHPLLLDGITIDISLEKDTVLITCEVRCEQKTGVEMEALTGASVAALTIYDMCKSVSHDMEIVEIKLKEKRGGKSGKIIRS